MTGNFFEFGPFEINAQGKPVRRETTWLNEVHLLFIDNPFGAGYSFAAKSDDYVTNMTEMAKNLYSALDKLVTKYPKWFDREFYITGESFAGHYIPVIAYTILNKGEYLSKQLKGVAIGDGWTDPYY
jgi:carboxypeptidase C (cathepsin A)